VLRNPRWDIIVVDNASTDETLEKIRSSGTAITVIANSQNKGFAGAINQAVERTQNEVFVILNPDTIAKPGSLDALAHALSSEKAGAAGGLLVDAAGRPERGFTVRRFPTLASALAEALLLNRLWPGNPWNRRYRCLDLDYSQAQRVDQPAGACLAVTRTAWLDVGGLDESFFPVWFEDVDFCHRLRDRGSQILYRPEAVFMHAGGHSVNKLSFAERQSFWYRNLLRYFGKHHGSWELILLRAGIVAGACMRALLSCLGLRPRGVTLMEALRGYRAAMLQAFRKDATSAARHSHAACT
jgi:GT2 family glycosyltransferase